jgi:hypothetical protein
MLPHPTDQDHCNSQPPQAKSGCHRAAKTNQEKIASLLSVGKLNRIEALCLTLNEILKDIDQKIDFISLDVEGHEFEVLGNHSAASILLKQHGYSKKFLLGSNSFYTHASDQGIFSW